MEVRIVSIKYKINQNVNGCVVDSAKRSAIIMLDNVKSYNRLEVKIVITLTYCGKVDLVSGSNRDISKLYDILRYEIKFTNQG